MDIYELRQTFGEKNLAKAGLNAEIKSRLVVGNQVIDLRCGANAPDSTRQHGGARGKRIHAGELLIVSGATGSWRGEALERGADPHRFKRPERGTTRVLELVCGF